MALSLNEEVADNSYEVCLVIPTLLAVVLSSSSDALSLLVQFDAQVVKDVSMYGGRQAESNEAFVVVGCGCAYSL